MDKRKWHAIIADLPEHSQHAGVLRGGSAAGDGAILSHDIV